MGADGDQANQPVGRSIGRDPNTQPKTIKFHAPEGQRRPRAPVPHGGQAKVHRRLRKAEPALLRLQLRLLRLRHDHGVGVVVLVVGLPVVLLPNALFLHSSILAVAPLLAPEGRRPQHGGRRGGRFLRPAAYVVLGCFGG